MLILSALLIALPLTFAAHVAEPTSLQLMSFNIRYANENDGANRWALRRDLVFKVIRQERPDVLGVQEALKLQLDDLQHELPEYGAVGVGRDDGRDAGEHAQILYLKSRFDVTNHGTFWFSDTPEVPGSRHWGNTVTRICTWAQMRDRKTGRQFAVYNLHLDHESQPSREKSAALLLKRMRGCFTTCFGAEKDAPRTEGKAREAGNVEHFRCSATQPIGRRAPLQGEGSCETASNESRPKLPTIVMGDFNAGESNAVVTTLLKAKSPKLQDTFRMKAPNAENVGTFHEFSGKPGPDKIDHIFVTQDFTIQDAAIVRTHDATHYPSDHFPVTAQVVLKSSGKQ